MFWALNIEERERKSINGDRASVKALTKGNPGSFEST